MNTPMEITEPRPTTTPSTTSERAPTKQSSSMIVGRGSVISMGVFITQSTPIYDRETNETLYGRVPAGSVVVAGSMPRDGGKYSLNCAVIVKKVDEQTRKKVGINALLRDL
jgi:2,3,4,5-tetrahydropyridine-2,6-dicarboxylate N-succinyltransferase